MYKSLNSTHNYKLYRRGNGWGIVKTDGGKFKRNEKLYKYSQLRPMNIIEAKRQLLLMNGEIKELKNITSLPFSFQVSF